MKKSATNHIYRSAIIDRDIAYNDDTPACKYNEGVGCYAHHCANCGWNPKVAEKRTKKLLTSNSYNVKVDVLETEDINK